MTGARTPRPRRRQASAAPPATGPAAGSATGSLVDHAERALHNWLAGGRYRPGDRLPPEQELAAMLGISRGTLRGALQRLEESGEIVRRQGSGTFVGRRTLPSALDERLERLEPYSSVAARRGLKLTCADLSVGRRPVDAEVAAELGINPGTKATTVLRTLIADEAPVAVMFDVVHPSIQLVSDEALRRSLEAGEMVLDLLVGAGVPVTHARTRVLPRLLDGRQRAGKQLGVRRATAVLELEELVYVGREERVLYSRDLFAPGALDVTVMRSPDETRPAPVVSPRGTR